MTNLKKYMLENNITQASVARLLGKSQPAISNILNGHAGLCVTDAKIIMRAYGLTWEDIYGGIEQ